ncbi:hypothetical protein NPIL_641891 [Nephila pilipes]|uniref:Uncharacterized protein n=1 Tax=Nephila pilipes TaxID=299642 RepID=A0A8X6T0V1_NEPPI|nr:hypothetical protein NPIL_641891 [Nephila pilipes]
MAVQAVDVLQDVCGHGQHQLDVCGRITSPQQDHSLGLQTRCAIQTVLSHRMGTASGFRVHLGLSHVQGITYTVLERIWKIKLRLDSDWANGYCTLGKQELPFSEL